MPQHLTVPFPSTAQLCAPPAAIPTTPPRPLTATGVDELVKVPLPSWPNRLRPQHLTVPSVIATHEWSPPDVIVALTARAPARGATAAAGTTLPWAVIRTRSNA